MGHQGQPLIFQRIFTTVQNFRHLRPLASNMAVGGVAWGLGNYMCQTATGSRFDPNICQLTLLFGALISTPMSYLWYCGPFRGGLAILPKMLKPRSKIAFALSQALLTNLLVTPLQNSMFIGYMQLNLHPHDHDVFSAVRRDL